GLVWGDVSPTNILVDRSGQLMGLLDFEGALAGDVVLNLGYCFASRYTSEFYRTIRSAWGAPTSDELCTRIELYAVLRGMRITKYAHNRNLPTGQPRMPIEELLPGFVVAASRLREKIRPEN
ncbi:MAG TPA: phosphotransferase, partial [Bacillota bacterium]|nr:phosphotransferase [Bacillota bacterium]